MVDTFKDSAPSVFYKNLNMIFLKKSIFVKYNIV